MANEFPDVRDLMYVTVLEEQISQVRNPELVSKFFARLSFVLPICKISIRRPTRERLSVPLSTGFHTSKER